MLLSSQYNYKNHPMSLFPLYDNLIKEPNSSKLSDEQKQNLVDNIEKLDLNGHELVYALMKKYQTEHSSENLQLPFKSKMLKKGGLKVNVEHLPDQLSSLILRFSKIHLQKMKEDLLFDNQYQKEDA